MKRQASRVSSEASVRRFGVWVVGVALPFFPFHCGLVWFGPIWFGLVGGGRGGGEVCA